MTGAHGVRRGDCGTPSPAEDHATLSAISTTATYCLPTRVEAYLTGKATALWPAALVVRVDDEHGTRFVLQRPGQQDLELGAEFAEARRALYAAIKHHRAGGRLPD